jgi:hypothetical protein
VALTYQKLLRHLGRERSVARAICKRTFRKEAHDGEAPSANGSPDKGAENP